MPTEPKLSPVRPSEPVWMRVHEVVPLRVGYACKGCYWRGELADVAAHVTQGQHRVGGDGRPYPPRR